MRDIGIYTVIALQVINNAPYDRGYDKLSQDPRSGGSWDRF